MDSASAVAPAGTIENAAPRRVFGAEGDTDPPIPSLWPSDYQSINDVDRIKKIASDDLMAWLIPKLTLINLTMDFS